MTIVWRIDFPVLIILCDLPMSTWKFGQNQTVLTLSDNAYKDIMYKYGALRFICISFMWRASPRWFARWIRMDDKTSEVRGALPNAYFVLWRYIIFWYIDDTTFRTDSGYWRHNINKKTNELRYQSRIAVAELVVGVIRINISVSNLQIIQWLVNVQRRNQWNIIN